MSIRERVLDWLTDHPDADFTVNRVALDLALTRAQARNALHGLKRQGLSNQLTAIGKNTWRYTPPARMVFDHQPMADGDKVPNSVPPGFVGQVRIVGKFGTNFYIAEALRDGRSTGKFLKIEPIDGAIEVLIPRRVVNGEVGKGEILKLDSEYARSHGRTVV